MQCHECNKNLKKDDINILGYFGFALHPFCNTCYSQKERNSIQRYFIYWPKFPLNGKFFKNWLQIITLIVAIWALFMLFVFQQAYLVFVVTFFIAWYWIQYFRARDLVEEL